MGKYEALAKHLGSLADRGEVTVSFSELENMLGFQLPASARKHRSWWANIGSRVQARDGWMGAGWIVWRASLKGETFKFKPELKLKGKTVKSKHYAFEELARRIMSKRFGVELSVRKLPQWPKSFDLVSPDCKIVGDAAYQKIYDKEARTLPGKLAHITELVWLLEKTNAEAKFIAFGGDEAVPERWLKRYGYMLEGVQFYFIDGGGAKALQAV